MTFSNLILTWFTHFLGARTMFKHIFGLIMVTQKLSGVQLNHDNGFQGIEHSKSIFPTVLVLPNLFRDLMQNLYHEVSMGNSRPNPDANKDQSNFSK